ncbi:hypothetical protein JCM19236_2199 [Vibrio sp. JCM 19236]|nr:hypothetical protein JCM19236_2199 [Vibrio sp. JCM 19236]
MKKRTQLGLLISSVALAMGSAQAAELEITITNATKGIYFTPLIVAAHNSELFMFRTGTAASDELKSMAEEGAIAGLSGVIGNAGGVVVENPAGGFLDPGDSITFNMDSGDLGYLSLGAMLLPTNDGFVGLDSWKIPSEAGTYRASLNGYDAGTEPMMRLLPICQTLHLSPSEQARPVLKRLSLMHGACASRNLR